MEIAKNLKKDFIFLTEVNKTVYLYNISKLTRKVMISNGLRNITELHRVHKTREVGETNRVPRGKGRNYFTYEITYIQSPRDIYTSLSL